MITFERESGSLACVARIVGDLDVVTVPELREAVDAAVTDGCATVILDLSAVTYLDSSALGFLVWADRRLQPRAGRLVLASAGRDVSRILELSGLIGVAPSVVAAATVDEVLAAMEPMPAMGEPEWSESFAFPAETSRMAEVRGRVSEIVASLGLPSPAVFDVKVAVGEALANAILHGSPQGARDEVRVDIRAFDDRVDIVVSDNGNGFDGVAPAPQDVYAAGGRGVAFMRALMDAVEFSVSDEGGTRVRLAKRRSANTTAAG